MNTGLTELYSSRDTYKKIIKYREFYNNDYFLKIALNTNKEIIFINYNIKILDSIKYEFKINIQDLYTLCSFFKNDRIEAIYNIILFSIESNYYIIEKK